MKNFFQTRELLDKTREDCRRFKVGSQIQGTEKGRSQRQTARIIFLDLTKNIKPYNSDRRTFLDMVEL